MPVTTNQNAQGAATPAAPQQTRRARQGTPAGASNMGYGVNLYPDRPGATPGATGAGGGGATGTNFAAPPGMNLDGTPTQPQPTAPTGSQTEQLRGGTTQGTSPPKQPWEDQGGVQEDYYNGAQQTNAQGAAATGAVAKAGARPITSAQAISAGMTEGRLYTTGNGDYLTREQYNASREGRLGRLPDGTYTITSQPIAAVGSGQAGAWATALGISPVGDAVSTELNTGEVQRGKADDIYGYGLSVLDDAQGRMQAGLDGGPINAGQVSVDDISSRDIGAERYTNAQLAQMAKRDNIGQVRGDYGTAQDFMQSILSGNNNFFNTGRMMTLDDLTGKFAGDRSATLREQERLGMSGGAMGAEQMRRQEAANQKTLNEALMGWEQADLASQMQAGEQSGELMKNMGGLENTQFNTQVGAQTAFGQQKLSDIQNELEADKSNQMSSLEASKSNQATQLGAQTANTGNKLKAQEIYQSGLTGLGDLANTYTNLGKAHADLSEQDRQRMNDAFNQQMGLAKFDLDKTMAGVNATQVQNDIQNANYDRMWQHILDQQLSPAQKAELEQASESTKVQILTSLISTMTGENGLEDDDREKFLADIQDHNSEFWKSGFLGGA